jgi:Rrf2 family protein
MVRNKAASYALMAMVEIAERKRNESAADLQAGDIAARFGLPVAYTAKVLSQLARSSLLRSDRGPRGGFQLARSPEDISLLEILKAVGAWNNGDFAMASTAPERLQRGVGQAVNQAMTQAKSVLERVRLSDLMSDHNAAGGAPVPATSAVA